MVSAVNKITPADAAQELLRRRQARISLAGYIEYVSGKTPARHMRFLCKKLEKAMVTPEHRLLICEPPGHAKSFITSWHFPAYYLSKFPTHNIVTVSHTDAFAETWGRRVRNLMLGTEHQILYPAVTVAEDSRAAGRWDTNQGGSYYATGVGGAVTGRRANLILIDDPIRGIEDADSPTVRENMWSWWAADLGTRLVPGGLVVLIQTRWHLDDLAGRVIASEETGGDKWEKIILPALAKKNDPLGRKPGEALWPEWQSVAALERIRRQPSMTPRIWESLYQQSPVVEAGNIVKREWIKLWRGADPPECSFILQSWDTAATKKERSAYSSCVTLGIFNEPETNNPAMILLSRWRGRVEYHDLKTMARRLAHNYLDDRFDMPKHNPVKNAPDMILIEDESTGKILLQDFARANIQAFAFPARRYGSKDARLNLSLDVIESGRLYVPAIPPMFTMPRKFADEFITSLTSFPASTSRDDVDALSQAIIRLKTSGWIYQPEDKPKEAPWRPHQAPEPIY